MAMRNRTLLRVHRNTDKFQGQASVTHDHHAAFLGYQGGVSANAMTSALQPLPELVLFTYRTYLFDGLLNVASRARDHQAKVDRS
jgi:hypothetical protein